MTTDAIAPPPDDRTPGRKLFTALLVAALLVIPLLAIYALNYDRQSQSETAHAAIAQGWGGPQVIAGPLLVVPYEEQVTETVTENNVPLTRAVTAKRKLFIAPTTIALTTDVKPERRAKSIYEAVVYDAVVAGRAQYRLPADLARIGVPAGALQWARAELRFGVSDPRGLKPANRVTVNGQALAAQPGNGVAATGGSGFFVGLDASGLANAPLTADFHFELRGNSTLGAGAQCGRDAVGGVLRRGRIPISAAGSSRNPRGRPPTASARPTRSATSRSAPRSPRPATRARATDGEVARSRQAQVGLMEPSTSTTRSIAA